MNATYAAIYAAVRRIPKGRVATYGQIAILAGANNPRQVGYALHALELDDVPWPRVINAKGEISLPDPARQRRLLEAEGVVFDNRGRVHLPTFRWQPAAG